MATFVSDSAWSALLDKASYLDMITLTKDIAESSTLLGLVMGRNMGIKKDKIGNAFPILKKTFSGSYDKRWEVDKSQIFDDETKLVDLHIDYGDTKTGVRTRDLMIATIFPAHFGATVTFTLEDKMKIESRKNEFADWIEGTWKRLKHAVAVELFYQMMYGAPNTDANQGQVTTTGGLTKAGFIGLETIVSTAKYAEKTTTDWTWWKGHTFDTNNALWEYAATDLDSVDELIAIPSNRSVPRLLDIMRRALSQIRSVSGEMGNYIFLMSPAVYDHLWLKCVEQVKVGLFELSTSSDKVRKLFGAQSGLDLTMYPLDSVYTIDSAAVFKENCAFNGKNLMRSDYIYILNLDDLVLEAHENANFKMSGWIPEPSKYEYLMNSFVATLRFYAKKRHSLGRIKLNTNVVTEITGYTGDIYTHNT